MVNLPPIVASSKQASYARLEGYWLVLARVCWLVVVMLTLAITGACLPGYLALLQTPCTRAVCEYQQFTAEQLATLSGQGLTPGAYMLVTLVIAIMAMVVCLSVSALIMWRRPDDRVAFIIALVLVTLGPINLIADVPPGSPVLLPSEFLLFLSQSLQVLGFLLFPGGQFAPRWMRWIFLVLLVVFIPASFFPFATLIPNMSASQPSWLVALAELVLGAFVQVYRYRRVSTPVQRQQTKWVVLGIAVPITFVLLMNMLILVFPALAIGSSLYLLLFNESGFLLPIFLPLSLGFAMLRYRLWEIDTLINRTLVYGLLTLILAALYIGLVFGLQALLRSVIKQDSGVAIVISTLIIAALFQPLRQRLQTLIDHRFYRYKYDAQKTLASFSATLHAEMDLHRLSERLVSIVDETMRPTSVSLWLCRPRQSPPQDADRPHPPL